jgi:uncharacterized phage protein gp47/JayE
MPLSSTGYIAYRASDFITQFQTEYENNLTTRGLSSDIDWDRDAFLGALSAVIGTLLGDLSEATQTLYDAFDLNNAEGQQLGNLGAIVGVLRNAATASTVTMSLTGTASAVIPAGTQFRGGSGSYSESVWELDSAVTLNGSGAGSGVATCTTTGAVVASAGTITTIVTPAAGLTSVTNAAAASAGNDEELDSAYRLRIVQSVQISGMRTIGALEANIRALDYIDGVVVMDNPQASTVVTGGVTLAPSSMSVIVYPSALTTDQQTEILGLIYDNVAAGTYCNGTDVVSTITGTSGASKRIAFDYATDYPVTVAVTLTMQTGYSVSSVTTAVQDAIGEYLTGLGVGSSAYLLEIYGLLDDITGIVGASVLLNGSAANVTPTLAEKIVLSGTVSVA